MRESRESRKSQHGCRTGRVRRRIGGPGAVPVLVAALTLAGGCSTPTPSHATAATPTNGVPRSSIRTLPHSPMIAAGTTAAAVSVAVSNALFDSAPTVVLAAEHDQPAHWRSAETQPTNPTGRNGAVCLAGRRPARWSADPPREIGELSPSPAQPVSRAVRRADPTADSDAAHSAGEPAPGMQPTLTTVAETADLFNLGH